jgi:hypothetical protein
MGLYVTGTQHALSRSQYTSQCYEAATFQRHAFQCAEAGPSGTLMLPTPVAAGRGDAWVYYKP